MKTAIPLAAAVALIHAGALAQTTPATDTLAAAPAKTAADQPESKPIIQVEVNGAGDYDPRRDDTASKTVIGQQEILKYGDTNVFDVLKRAPGVTVMGESIRMRGLGNGYTQVLVNGERPPPGFTLQSVTPEQIEKIEIVRAATAEFSTQAIAGTINIVLKKVVSKPQRDLRFNFTGSSETKSAFAIGTLADRSGNLSYFLNAVLARSTGSYRDSLTEQLAANDGTVLQQRDSSGRNDSGFTGLTLAPRLNWKLSGIGQLNWSARVTDNRFDGDNSRVYTDRVGAFPEPNFMYRAGRNANHSVSGETTVNWVTALAGGKLDTSLSVSGNRNNSEVDWTSATANRERTLQRSNDGASRNILVRSTGKYTRTMLGDHALVTGWEVSRQRTREDRHRVEGFTGAAPAVFDERFVPVVVQAAAYVQDEWNVTRLWSMYVGARFESIRTDSAVSGAPDTSSRNHVLSPIAQTLYKFPDRSGRQLRLALTRTFKAPTTLQLTARRNESDFNTRFAPDSSGNPALQPELATGVDLTYEHFWAPAALFSVSASNRHITDYIRTTLAQDGQGRWLYQPVNDGKADVRSLGVELKFPSKLVWKELPAFDLRANVNRNWSQVASVPGPDNRLDQQIPLTASLGVDNKRGDYTMGANLGFRSGGPVRISAQQSTRLQTYRDLDAYLLYQVNPTLQLRFAGSNLLAKDNEFVSRYADSNGVSANRGRNTNGRRLMLNFEFKL
jgi:outer membrane receptor for ferrienterochelin and colicin